MALGRSRRGSASSVAAVIFAVMVAATAISGAMIYYSRGGTSPSVGANPSPGSGPSGALSNPALTNLTSALGGLSGNLSSPALANLTSALGELSSALSNSTLANFTLAIGGPISVTDAELAAEDFTATGTTSTFTCSASPPSAAYLALTGNLTGSASVTSVSIASTQGVASFTPSGSCYVAAAGQSGGTTYIVFPSTSELSPGPLPGSYYAGAVSLSDGSQIPFEGVWQ